MCHLSQLLFFFYFLRCEIFSLKQGSQLQVSALYFVVYLFFSREFMGTTWMQKLSEARKRVRSLELEVEVVMSCHAYAEE